MGRDTPHLNLRVPSFGETGWVNRVNDSFDTLDAAIAPFTRTLYARPTGDNANDGTSWAKAKKDILGAFDALPSTGGKILFETGTYADAAHPTRGFWLAGANDSNYNGTLPAGWRQFNGALHIEGVEVDVTEGSRRPGAYLYGGSTTSTASPLFWFSGCQQGVTLKNIHSPTALARPMELGKDSGTGLASNNANFVFDNVSLNADTGDASHGPVINATSAYWVYMNQMTLKANGQAAKTTTNRAVYHMVGGANSYHGIVYIKDSNFNRGGGVIQSGTSSDCVVTIDHVVQEAPLAGDSAPIFWWNVRVDNSNTSGQATITGCLQADQVPALSDAMVKVHAGNNPGFVVVSGSSTGVDGPCTVLNQTPHATTKVSPGSSRATGSVGDKLVAQHDAHRRSFGPSAVRALNLASQDTAAWGALAGGATVTTGASGPDGSTNAATLSGASALYKQVVDSSRTVAVGDWVIAGVWAKAVTTTWGDPPLVLWADSNNLFDASDAGVSFFEVKFPWAASTKEWVWLSAAYKVTQASTTPSRILMRLNATVGASMVYFAPVLLHIATGVHSDAEMLEIYRNLAAWPDSASAGQVALMRDQHLHVPRGYVEIGEMTAPAAGATNYGRLFMVDSGAGKTKLMVQFATGAAQQIAIEP